MSESQGVGGGVGRPPATSREQLERVAFELFEARGFEATTVDDLASAAGVSRRTFFRYFPSKNDVVWGDFEALLRDLRAWLAAVPAGADVLEALGDAVVRFNSLPPDAVADHRRRMALILHVPALQAHSTLRYAAWRDVVAGFVAERTVAAADDPLPRLVGHVALGASVASYERWLAEPGADLDRLLAAAFTEVRSGFASLGATVGPRR